MAKKQQILLFLKMLSHRSSVMNKSNTHFNERRENLFKENIPAFSVQEKSCSQFPFRTKIWWQSSRTFQKVNYVTCSLVLWKYTFRVICAKMLQIRRKIYFKVNTFFYRSLKKRLKKILYLMKFSLIRISTTIANKKNDKQSDKKTP